MQRWPFWQIWQPMSRLIDFAPIKSWIKSISNWCLHCNGLLTFQNNTKNLRVTLRQNWKNISFAGKCKHAKPSESGPFYPVHFPHNVTWNLWKTFKAFFSRVINLLLTKLARDRTGRISALGLFCTDRAQRGPYCQDLGPIFSQYGPRAWLIRCIYRILHGLKNKTGKDLMLQIL